MNSIKFGPIPPTQIFILILVLFSMFFIIYLQPRLSKKKLVNKNEHGSSKFADMEEIKNTFVKENIKGSETIGFPVWFEKNNNQFESVYFDNKSPHYLLIGSTGSGKSVTVVIPECLMFATSKEKHSVVVTDPKGEIFRKTSKVFADNGYNVITIDFRNPNKSKRINIMQPIINEWKEYCIYNDMMLFLFSHFIKSNKISLNKLDNDKYLKNIKDKYGLEDYLFDIIINNKNEIEKNTKNRKMYETNLFDNYLDKLHKNTKEYLESKSNEDLLDMIKEFQNCSSKHQAESNRLVISLADLIFVDKDTNDKFWINSAKQLFIGIVGIFLEDYQSGIISENKINISSVKKFQNSSLIKENQTFLKNNLNSRKYGSLSKDYLTSILSAADNTYKSITAVFGEKMAIFDDLNVENVTSTNEFSFTDLGSKPTALYIIVPDEDRAYFQLVTIIIGMLTKDLTKFANLPENNGTLPVKIEWLLDEFANCPPLSSIETLVSVARSRGMRFQFFIQSFSQLNQVYGKEIASIIQDNCSLVYLKTNTVETAEIISKKLGRATIETNSMSRSTDPMKVGANQTTSLMGKELLTVNEIIGLKYKTIIFPTISNPIFRDTYLYSDIFPEYAEIDELQRETNVLKRVTSNYYTVEDLRKGYEMDTNAKVKRVNNNIQRQMRKNVDKIVKENEAKSKAEQSSNLKRISDKVVEDILFNVNYNVIFLDKKTCVIEIDTLLSNITIEKLENIEKEDVVLSVMTNEKNCITKIMIYDNKKEKGIV